MDLPNLLSKIKPSPDTGKFFLAIEIAANSIKTALWHASGETTQINALGSIQDWDGQTSEDLLLAVDTSLSEALTGSEQEPNEVIFGLPEAWVDQSGITESQKPLLQEICQKLALKPVGFVVTTEAIVHHLQEQAGGPPSVILIQLTPEELIVSLVKQGVLKATHVVGRSDSISSDVQEGLARFHETKQLPSRILLYNSKEDLEGIKQELLAFDWPESLPFLHLPQIDSLDKHGSIEAVALSGGLEVARSLGITLNQATEQSPILDDEAEAIPQDTAPGDSLPTLPFGFIPLENSDQALKAVSKPTTHTDSMLINKQGVKQSESNVIPVDKSELFPQNTDSEVSKLEPEPIKSKKISLPHFKLPKLPRLKLPLVRFGIHPILLIGVFGIAALLVAGLIYYWTVPQADVTIYISPEVLDREITFTLDPELTQIDTNNQSLPATINTIELNGSKTAPTTGTKTVGERAKGTVEVFNRTLNSKSFESGTTIAVDQYRYTLDENITIASASSQENNDFSITLKPSSQTVTVTAVAIGDRYNVPQDTQFTVENFATEDYLARATTAFTGGSSREVQAVSDADYEGLRQDLITDLKKQLNSQVATESQNENATIPLEDPEIIEQTYSHDLGDEADSLTLEVIVNQSFYQYNTGDLNQLAQEQVLSDIPDNFELLKEATQVQVTDTTTDSEGAATVSATTRLYLMPSINIDDIAKTIAGKYPPETESFLKSIPNYVKTETLIKPKLPARLSTFPRKVEKIHITVKPAGL
jgi:hypothetical protein